MLVADGQLPAAFAPARRQDGPSVPVGHARKKAVFAAARNTLWLPGSFGHVAEFTPTSMLSKELKIPFSGVAGQSSKKCPAYHWVRP